MKKRILSLLLVLCMVVSLLPSAALAAEPETAGEADGLCPHHTEHTADCGYAAAVAGADCQHECSAETGCIVCIHEQHDENCGYAEAVEGHECGHTHDDECGYVAAVDGALCNHECSEETGCTEDECAHVHDEDCGYVEAVEGHECGHQHDVDCGYVKAVEASACQHECTVESGCIVCIHEHDEDCGYVEAVAASPCTFECEQCKQGGIVYSDAELTLTGTTDLAEGGGDYTVTLTRGDASGAAQYTVVVYDNSANYGEDYSIWYNGEEVDKIDGATSVYDAFRDGGELTDGIDFDMAVAVGAAESEASGEELPSVSAAAILSQLDELGAKAAQFTVAFADGESQIELTIRVADDDESEYEETFLMAVLDGEGEAIESAQQIFAITDNDEAPSVTVSFSCDEEMELTNENQRAELTFRRRGDLATTTVAILYLDGEPYGKVDFTPWQKKQTVDAVEAGVYTLTYSDGGEIEGQVEVFDNRTATQSVAEGADPVLDAIPDEYAVIRTPRTSELDNTAWLPGWATGRETTNEYQTIYLGSAKDNNLFKAGGNSSKGSVTFFVDDLNIHEVSTSGDGTYVSTGELWADSKKSYDFTGVESVESTVYVNGVDHQANISIGVYQTVCKTINITDDGTYTLTAALPSKYQGTKYVYYHNEDPKTTMCGGTNMFVPNGFKMNLRQYRFIIEDDADIVDPGTKKADGKMDYTTCTLYYNGGKAPGRWVPNIDKTKTEQYRTINSKDYGTKNKTVDICFECDSEYPATLVGYKLMNDSTGVCSEMIPLTDDSNGSGSGTASITFDTNFLKKYEEKYCAWLKSDLDNTEAWTFHIIPVYEKVDTRAEIISSDAGYLYVNGEASGEGIGDRWVFYGAGKSGSSMQLSGVWVQAFDNTSDIPVKQYISMTPYTGASTVNGNQYVVDIEYPRYKVQGVFSTDSTHLMLYYADDTAKLHGTIESNRRNNNEVVSTEQYVIGDYVTLVAKPNDGYITRWKVDGISQYYYGDVFYYQLDGNPDHNIIYVDFVAENSSEGKQSTAALAGKLEQAYVKVRLNGTTSWVPMDNTTITITADKTYTVVTDEKGEFIINNFTGVANGTYSMSVVYDEAIGYTTFTYVPDGSIKVQMPQFATGVPYPSNVSADVDGAGSTQNMLSLTSAGKLNITARVYVPPKNYTVTDVNFYFLNPTLVDGGAGTSAAKAYEAGYVRTDGDYQIWSIQITDTSEIKSGMQLYVEVVSDKVIYQNDKNGGYVTETTSISTGLVDSGYGLTTADKEESYSISYPVPESPSMQSSNIDLSSIEIPILGKLDFSLSSKTGGFFSQRTDGDDTILVCGSTYLNYFGTTTVDKKLEDKRKTAAALSAAEKAGAANADVTAVGNRNVATVSAPSKWTFAPAYMFKFTLSKTSDGSGTYLSRYEMALGVDANYIRNIPFSVYGVPFYVCLIFTGEAYFDIQAEFAESSNMSMEDVTEEIVTDGSASAIDTFITAPVMSFTAKGGVGYNTFLSLYLSASVTCPFIISLTPSTDGVDIGAAANFGFSIAAGADLVLFSGEIKKSIPVAYVGDEDLKADLKTISGQAAASVSTQALRSASRSVDLEELLEDVTFAPMARSGALRRSVSSDGTIASSVFKNTGVHLLKLDEDNILAFYLKDTAGDEDTLNYLTVAYSVSEDGGESWGKMNYVSDNTGNPNTSLQFDVNLFDLGDRTLVTWSEANFDEVLKNLDDVDIEHLTPAQISKFMNAMDLKGRFFDEDGKPMGEAFTIAENSTVACGALDAVKNGDMVYVYYQRNFFPYDESDGEITLTDLLSTDRTIAMARASVKDTSEWISTPVRAAKENGQQYRITDVEPFVHDGVMGEILVLDRDGKLAEWNDDTESWDASNEDRQLYLRTYTFDEQTGEPIPSALLAITDPKVCAQSPQVVSNDDYLHLIWNQNGQIVYLTDFVATYKDNEDVQEIAYVLVDRDGEATAQHKGKYYANDIASADEYFHIGTTFSASMDDDGHVLLSWVASDPASTELTDEIYGVVLETVTNDEAVQRAKSDTDHNVNNTTATGNDQIYQLYAQGSPVALTDEDSLIGALDSVFLSDEPDSSRFLLAFSKLDDVLREQAESADIVAMQSVYESGLDITDVSAPQYPMPGSEMTVSVTVVNKGLGEATDVEVTAEGVGRGASETIDSILPGRSKTVELTIVVPDDFDDDTILTVTVDDNESDDTAEMDIYYGPCFQVKNMPVMYNLAGSSSYRTETTVYNAGNAAGVPTLNYEVTIFASSEELKEYSYTGSNEIQPGGSAVLTYVLEDTPVTTGKTGTLSILVETGDKALELYQCIQGQMPKLTAVVTLADLNGSDEPDEPDDDWDYEEPTYRPTVEDTENGSVSVTPKYPEQGDKVTITVKPDKGYVVDTVTVTTRSGKTVKVTDNGDGTYSFTQPAGTVSIEVTFAPETTELPAELPAISFTDVKENDWFYTAVQWGVANGITNGMGDGSFGPDLEITREQLAVMLYRCAQLLGCDTTIGGMAIREFDDYDGISEYARTAMTWMVNAGLMNGSGNLLMPSGTATREQLVTILYRFAQYMGFDTTQGGMAIREFDDYDSISQYALSAMTWAVNAEILNGYGNGLVAPQGAVTRAQSVTLLMNWILSMQ